MPKILTWVVSLPSDLRGILRGDLRGILRGDLRGDLRGILRGSGKYYLSITLFCRVKIFDVPLQQT